MCARCRASLRKSDDDAFLSAHSSGALIGRVRRPTDDELASPEVMFRPDAVVELAAPLPRDVSPVEVHVGSLIDGVRPVARIKKKSGLSSDDLRVALGQLRDRRLLKLVGVIEEAIGPWADDIAAEVAERTRASEEHSIKGSGEYIPPHVMSEIQSMIDEEERAKVRDALDDDDDGGGTDFEGDTTEGPAPKR
ncbi:MAG: hypothetical protein A2138_06820 [Deltaproteobacteria bacterium RBG_16_71_12]|nr:MAG: hypothetical protein A2138_06820 [Deltaproteobacteria bacterium RBG_16_71_12]